MGWLTWLAIFFTTWWVVLFTMLPIGARPPEQVEQGHATSAPATPMLAKKALWTTIITTVLVVAGWLLFNTGILDWRELTRPGEAPFQR